MVKLKSADGTDNQQEMLAFHLFPRCSMHHKNRSADGRIRQRRFTPSETFRRIVMQVARRKTKHYVEPWNLKQMGIYYYLPLYEYYYLIHNFNYILTVNLYGSLAQL